MKGQGGILLVNAFVTASETTSPPGFSLTVLAILLPSLQVLLTIQRQNISDPVPPVLFIITHSE